MSATTAHHLPPTEIAVADPESVASLRISFGQLRLIRAGGGGGGTWRSIQGKLSRPVTSCLPISVSPIHPAVFLDSGLRAFDDVSDHQSTSSFLLDLPNLQRSPHLFLTLARIVEACSKQLKADGDSRLLSFPNPLWMRVDSSIRSAPCIKEDKTRTMEPISFFRKRSGYYFLKLQVSGIHLPANSDEWCIKFRVTDFMLTEAPLDAPSDNLVSCATRIQAPLPLSSSSSRKSLPPPPPPAPQRQRKVARMSSSKTAGGGGNVRMREKPDQQQRDEEEEEDNRLPPQTQPIPFAGSPTSESDADDEQ
jgi:hypothetical protein